MELPYRLQEHHPEQSDCETISELKSLTVPCEQIVSGNFEPSKLVSASLKLNCDGQHGALRPAPNCEVGCVDWKRGRSRSPDTSVVMRTREQCYWFISSVMSSIMRGLAGDYLGFFFFFFLGEWPNPNNGKKPLRCRSLSELC